MTVDEALTKLEENIRRAKIEYEAYFNGGLPRPPHDTVFRIETALKKYSCEIAELNFGQRFRLNQLAQKYAVYNDLWRKKLLQKEEGRGRGEARKHAAPEKASDLPFYILCSDPEKEKDKVDELLRAIIRAKDQVGEHGEGVDPEVFAKFVREKTKQIKESLGCDAVKFSVRVEGGKVRFKAARP